MTPNHTPEYHPHRKRGLLGLVAVVVLSLVFAAAALFSVVSRNNENADVAKARAESAQALARQAQEIGARIQAERVRNIRDGCEAQNMRHRNAVKFIDSYIRKSPPAQRAAAEANRKVTVRFINTLAPLQNCDEVVARQTRPGKP